MNPKSPHDPLAVWTDRVLAQSPAPVAPTALAPRVLAEIRRRATCPWYRRPWTEWPRPWQALSGAGLLATVAGTGWLIRGWWQPPRLADVRSEAVAELGQASVVVEVAGALGQALHLALKQIGQPWVLTCGAVVLVAWLACLGLGTVAWRLTKGGRS
jgi:hypothetical protein